VYAINYRSIRGSTWVCHVLFSSFLSHWSESE